MNLTSMDYIRAALYNALGSGITLEEVAEMSRYAETPEDFDTAVNILSTATPDGFGAAWTEQGWVKVK